MLISFRLIDYTSEGDIRLIGASSENEGRVEIYHDGTWGTVCDDNWDINDAEVVCNQLGFPGALLADDNAYFGEGSGPILLDDVSCNGDEHYLTDCRHGGWYSNDCGHVEDAGVICNIPSFHYPRLVNGDKWYEGRVEVWNGYQWTKFCSDEGLRDNEAGVICKELGFDGVDYVIYSHRFGEGKAPPSDVYYSCTSYEDSLSQCDNFFRSEYYCTSSALRCKYNHLLPVGAIVGTTIGVVISIILCSVCFLAIYNRSKAWKNRRRNPPNVTVISGSTNQAGPTVHFAAQPAVPPTSGNEQAPPSYNDVVDNPGFYPVAYPGTYGLPGVQNPYKAQLHSPVGASEVQYSTENPIP
ncbi:Deleted in malignant brain tumors 1 protein [Holothuria leucospilota]|uniref:Deleted in malignant brain tumors 1 protein n=1 Tax=Holothuria leucospilota TaxID=206669 RepID=A0A9Q1BHU5_HOLLE|nr:Deleted in malignant brain tumors 1 protein [Holothuria leucospilota]